MMRRFSLSQRLTLLFVLLMMLCAAVACAEGGSDGRKQACVGCT